MLRIRTIFLIQNRTKVLLQQRRGNSIYLGMFKVECFTDDCFSLHSCGLSILGEVLNTHVDQIQLLDLSFFSQWKNCTEVWFSLVRLPRPGNVFLRNQGPESGLLRSLLPGVGYWLPARSPLLCKQTSHLASNGWERQLVKEVVWADWVVKWWAQKSCFLSKEQVELLALMFVKDNYQFQAQSRIL